MWYTGVVCWATLIIKKAKISYPERKELVKTFFSLKTIIIKRESIKTKK